MITRREYLKLSAAAGVALAISPKRLLADDTTRALITRAIPGTSEQLPVVGLGSSASFARVAGWTRPSRASANRPSTWCRSTTWATCPPSSPSCTRPRPPAASATSA